MNDEFYIGWESKAPVSYRRAIRRALLLLALLAVAVPALLAISQRLIGAAVFEWGTKTKFTGIFRAWPYPHLLVPRPAALGAPESYSTYFLVAPWKYGLSPEAVAKFDGKYVSLSGALVYRADQTMVEVNSADIVEVSGRPAPASLPETVSHGSRTLTGEILDSKCYFGAMNPGRLTPHRACAAMCIGDGIPPVFLVTQSNRPPTCLLLVSRAGKAVNQQVLDFVAEPMEIAGELKSQDGLLVLCADPADYRRVK